MFGKIILLVIAYFVFTALAGQVKLGQVTLSTEPSTSAITAQAVSEKKEAQPAKVEAQVQPETKPQPRQETKPKSAIQAEIDRQPTNDEFRFVDGNYSRLNMRK